MASSGSLGSSGSGLGNEALGAPGGGEETYSLSGTFAFTFAAPGSAGHPYAVSGTFALAFAAAGRITGGHRVKTLSGVFALAFSASGALSGSSPAGIAARASLNQVVGLRVRIWSGAYDGGSPVDVATAIAADVTNQVWGFAGGGPQPATARVTLAGPASTYLDPTSYPRQRITVEATLDGTNYDTLFTGLTMIPDQTYFPQMTVILATGYLDLANEGLPDAKVYANAGDDGDIVDSLLAASGVGSRDIHGSGLTCYNVHPLIVPARGQAAGFIGPLDWLTLRPTRDSRDGRVKRDVSFVDSTASSFAFVEGTPSAGQEYALRTGRRRDTKRSLDRVRVLGYLPQDLSINRPNAGRRRGGSVSWGSGRDQVGTINAEALESDADCMTAATWHMQFRDRVEDVAAWQVLGNAEIEPMKVVTITSASVDIGGANDYRVLGVHHAVSAASWLTDFTAIKATLGSSGNAYSLLPTPAFSWTAQVLPNPLRGGLSYYTYYYDMDGSGSTDEGGAPGTLLDYDWSVDASQAKRSGNGVGVLADGLPASRFKWNLDGAIAHMGNTHVTLRVTNQDRLSNTLTQGL